MEYRSSGVELPAESATHGPERFWAGLVAVLMAGGVAASAAWAQPRSVPATDALSLPEAMACVAQLSAAQRSRFQLAVQGCSTSPQRLTAPPASHADALVATAPLPRAEAEVPAQESAHLRLFDQPGVVTSQLAPPLMAAPPPPAASPVPRRGSTKRPRGAAPSADKTSAAPTALRRALSLASEVDEVARRHGIDPLLMHAIAYVESRHNPVAVSPAGARGVMQVMPATGRRFGVAQTHDLENPRTNLEVGATYLKTLQARFSGDLSLVLAAYNAGEGAVERHGRRIPPFAETQSYVRQVMSKYRALSLAAGRQPIAVD